MKKIVGLAAAVAVLLTGCSSAAPAATPTPTPGPPASKFRSIAQIGDALGCQPLTPGQAWDTSMKAASDCELPGDVFMGVLEFDTATKRDAMLASSTSGVAAWLVLSAKFVVSGQGDDIIAARDKLKEGEVRAGVVPPDSGKDAGEVEPEAEDEPTEEPKALVYPYGKAATYENNYGVEEQVKVDKVNCGSKSGKLKLRMSCRQTKISEMDANPAWDGSEDIPEYITAKASKNHEFFVVAFKWKNVGKKPGMASSFGTLLSVNGTEYEQNTAYTERLTKTARGNEDLMPTNNFNPGMGFRTILVYEVPKGVKVTGIHWGISPVIDQDNSPKVLFTVK